MKITWIVDAGYLLRSSPGSFDYLLLKNQIESMMGTSFFESYYLNSTPSNRSDAQEGFNTWLKNAPPFGPKMHVQLYRLKTVRCKCPDCSEWFDRNVQQGVDVGIVTLLMKLAVQDQYDRLLLSIGDGEYQEAISFVKREFQKEIWLCGYEGTISPDLQCYADNILWLDDHYSNFQKEEREE